MTKKEFNELTQTGVVVVDFYATWCGPCRMLTPIFDELSVKLANKASFLKIDIDQSMELAQAYQITSVPTIMIFKDGHRQEILTGFMPQVVLEEKINVYL